MHRVSASVEFLLPFYGDPALCRETIASVLLQDSEQWSLTLVDDCHPDTSIGTWLEGLGDMRVKYIRNEANLGANGNYCRALDFATADYVCILGADDLLLPSYVTRMTEILASSANPSAIQPGVQVINGAGERIMPVGDRVKAWLRPRPRPSAASVLSGERLVRSLLYGNWTYFPSLLWDRRLIQDCGFRDFEVVQDLALLIDVALAGGDLVVDPEITFAYRRHATNDSAIKSLSGARFAEERRYFHLIAQELDEKRWDRAARCARRRVISRLHALTVLPRAVRARDWPASVGLLRHALET